MSSPKEKKDIFDLTFEGLCTSLINNNYYYENNKSCLLNNSKIKKYDSKISSNIKTNLNNNALNRLNELKKYKKKILEKFKNEIDKEYELDKSLYLSSNIAKNLCLNQKKAGENKLKLQKDTAERRLRELVFEIIGEYGKSGMRIEKRQTYLNYFDRIKFASLIMQTQWKRFAARLCYESFTLNNNLDHNSLKEVNYLVLSVQNNKDLEEIKNIELKIKKKIISKLNSTFKVSAVIRIMKSGKGGINDNNNNNNPNQRQLSQPYFIANNFNELNLFSPELSNWALKESRNNSNISSPKVSNKIYNERLVGKFNTFLKSNHIDWLHPSSFNPLLWNSLASSLSNDNVDINIEVPPNKPKEERNKSVFKDNNEDHSDSSIHFNSLDSFLMRYSLQHSSIVVSNRLYFSLEERSMSNENDFVHEDESYESMLGALNQLQNSYVSKNSSFSKSDSSTDLKKLRKILSSEPLIVNDNLGSHRNKRYPPNISTSITTILKSFPNIIKTSSFSGIDFHFAPASIINTIECNEFHSQLNNLDDLSSLHEYLHNLAKKIKDLNLKPLLSKLFCLVKVFPLNKLVDDSITSKTVSNKEPILLIFPLSDICMNEIIQVYTINKSQQSKELINNSSSNNKKNINFIYNLPDHARYRCFDPINNYMSFSNFEKEKQENSFIFRNKYILFEDSYDDSITYPTMSSNCLYFVQIKEYLDDNNNNKFDENKYDNQTIENKLQSDDNLLHKLLCISSNLSSDINRTDIKDDIDDNETDDTDNIQVKKKEQSSKRKWDANVLSSLCRWRSCLCESTTDSSTKFLCLYHLELKYYIDGYNNQSEKRQITNESLKFLPKKSPDVSLVTNKMKKDLVVIRAASTLLQEIWDGKLRTTVKSFIKKTVKEMKCRIRLENCLNLFFKDQNNSNFYNIISQSNTMLIPPKWAIWKDSNEINSSSEMAESSVNALTYLLDTEKLLTEEICKLMEYRVFPSLELSQIRKEVKLFKDSLEETESQISDISNYSKKFEILAFNTVKENKLCERKLVLIRQRRSDEHDIRVAALRKISKIKSVEERQRHDPNNFGNQKSF